MKKIIHIRELMEDREAEEMTKKGFLKRYKPIMGRIEAKMEQIERMENALFPGARILSGTPGGGQPGGGMEKTDNAIDKLRRMRSGILKEIRELEAVRDEIINAINAVPDETLRLLLEERYINFHSWRQIARNMNYSEDYIYRLHQDALKKLRIREGKAA